MTAATKKTPLKKLCGFAGALMVLGSLAACGSNSQVDGVYPERQRGEYKPTYSKPGEEKRESLFGEGGISFGDNPKANNDGGGAGIGVNSFLWRATLDTLSFMPLASADPFGGVIITDWYSPVETPGERFKTTAYIMGTALRSDAIRVSVFRQVKGADGQWLDQVVGGETNTQIEDAILTRARELRVSGR